MMKNGRKILIGSLLVLTVCLLVGCQKEKDAEFPKDKQGYPKHDIVLINGKEYKLSGTEKEIEIKLPKDETLEISLPQYSLTHFWYMEENVTLNVTNYNKKEVSVPKMLEGVTSNVQNFCIDVTECNIVTFKWANVNECGKSFSEKQADYLLKIKIVNE